MELLKLDDFPLKAFDKIRYGDTDRQGHINNATFLTYLETGRVELIYHPDFRALDENNSFVIASVKLDFIKEIKWPGSIDIGTGIINIGNSSIRLHQQLFQHDQCMASSETVIVQVNDQKGVSRPLSDRAKEALEKWIITV
ncbi:MAG: thioesterase family protein [Cyclobacteriaceae bacterium]